MAEAAALSPSTLQQHKAGRQRALALQAVMIQSLSLVSDAASCAQALTMLAERTECDVRSCLNTLQFLGRRQKSVRTADVAHAQTGQKDISRNAFAVWQELFWQRVRFLQCHRILGAYLWAHSRYTPCCASEARKGSEVVADTLEGSVCSTTGNYTYHVPVKGQLTIRIPHDIGRRCKMLRHPLRTLQGSY